MLVHRSMLSICMEPVPLPVIIIANFYRSILTDRYCLFAAKPVTISAVVFASFCENSMLLIDGLSPIDTDHFSCNLHLYQPLYPSNFERDHCYQSILLERSILPVRLPACTSVGHYIRATLRKTVNVFLVETVDLFGATGRDAP